VSTAELTRQLYDAYGRRDWDRAALCLHEEAVLEMPATRERLAGRDSVIGFQRDYPEPWGELSVLRLVDAGDTAAAEVEVVASEATFRMAAFWVSGDGLLREGVEYWITVGGEEPPPSRRRARD
jgi:ketosteroid isomerase-like protein